jgi:hypothetical protein
LFAIFEFVVTLDILEAVFESTEILITIWVTFDGFFPVRYIIFPASNKQGAVSVAHLSLTVSFVINEVTNVTILASGKYVKASAVSLVKFKEALIVGAVSPTAATFAIGHVLNDFSFVFSPIWQLNTAKTNSYLAWPIFWVLVPSIFNAIVVFILNIFMLNLLCNDFSLCQHVLLILANTILNRLLPIDERLYGLKCN